MIPFKRAAFAAWSVVFAAAFGHASVCHADEFLVPFPIAGKSDAAVASVSVLSGESGGGAADCQDCCAEPPWAAWINKLPYKPIARLGNMPVYPSGPGYYSVKDVLTGNYQQDRPRLGGAPPFALNVYSMFELDYRYLDDPNYVSNDFFDRFHNIHAGNNWLLNMGGQFDWRYMGEINSRLSGKTDDFNVYRERVYFDAWYQDTFRFFAELISASNVGQNNLPPQPTDQDAIDFLNLFVSVKMFEVDGYGAYLTIGRQEQTIGSQRLLGSQEWANTRKTYQGVHGSYTNDEYDVDAFWVQPVIPNPDGWSWIDRSQELASVRVAYRPEKLISFEGYWLFLDDSHTVTTLGLTQDPTSVHCLGGRAVGNKDNFLWDFEPIVEVGQRGSQSILAESVTAGIGYTFPNLPMQPTIWGFYDWASGDHHPGTGEYTTFNQIYPFGHYYLGFMDLIGRENIRDWNFHLWLFPTNYVIF